MFSLTHFVQPNTPFGLAYAGLSSKSSSTSHLAIGGEFSGPIG